MPLSVLVLGFNYQNAPPSICFTDTTPLAFLHTKCEKCEHHLLYMTSILYYTFYLFTCIIFASTWHTVQVTRQFLNKRFKSSSSLWCADGKYFQFIAYFLYFVPNIQSLTGKKYIHIWDSKIKLPLPRCPSSNHSYTQRSKSTLLFDLQITTIL